MRFRLTSARILMVMVGVGSLLSWPAGLSAQPPAGPMPQPKSPPPEAKVDIVQVLAAIQADLKALRTDVEGLKQAQPNKIIIPSPPAEAVTKGSDLEKRVKDLEAYQKNMTPPPYWWRQHGYGGFSGLSGISGFGCFGGTGGFGGLGFPPHYLFPAPSPRYYHPADCAPTRAVEPCVPPVRAVEPCVEPVRAIQPYAQPVRTIRPCRSDAGGRVGRAICVAVNEVDADYYKGWKPPLTACSNDAWHMANLASAHGFQVLPLVNEMATWPVLYHQLHAASQELKAGDTLLLTFSGPGGEALVSYGPKVGHYQKTWCLHHGEVFLDELKHAFGWFADGVNIVVIADTGHYDAAVTGKTKTRALPSPVRDAIDADPVLGPYYTARWRQYRNEEVAEAAIAASVVMFTAAHDGEAALEGQEMGAFTGSLLEALARAGTFGNYRDLYREVYDTMKKKNLVQKPMIETMGRNASVLVEQTPFLWFGDRQRGWGR